VLTGTKCFTTKFSRGARNQTTCLRSSRTTLPAVGCHRHPHWAVGTRTTEAHRASPRAPLAKIAADTWQSLLDLKPRGRSIAGHPNWPRRHDEIRRVAVPRPGKSVG
jgi:hypothetical protein